MFKTEKELVVEITKNLGDPKHLKTLFSKNFKSKIFEELNLGYGIPDVVVVQYKNNKSLKKRKEFLNYFDISILDLIEKKEQVSIEDIVFLTKSTKSKINNTLSLLQSEKLILYREGKYFSHKKYAGALEDCLAIEAKLKNWKRALEQAYRYRWFSNKSFVMLPGENINPALKNISLFEKYGVGLASIDKERGIEVHYQPTETVPYSERMHKLLNEHLLSDLNIE